MAYHWLQVQSDHVDDGQQIVWVGMNSFRYDNDSHGFENEVVVGIDPDQSELDQTLGIGEKTRFAGVKFQYDYTWLLEEDELWRFVAQSSLIYQDLEDTGFNSIQLLVGAEYMLGDFQIALNIEGLGSTSRLDTNRSFSESSGKLEVLYEI